MGEFLRNVAQGAYPPKDKLPDPSRIGILVPGFLIPARKPKRLPPVTPIAPLAQAFADRSGITTYTVNTTSWDSPSDRAERIADAVVVNPQSHDADEVSVYTQSHGITLGDPLVKAFKDRGLRVRVAAHITPRRFDQVSMPRLAAAVLLDMGRTTKEIARHPINEFHSLGAVARYLGVSVPNLLKKIATGEVIRELRECSLIGPSNDNTDVPTIIVLEENDPIVNRRKLHNGDNNAFAQLLPNSPHVGILVMPRGHHGSPLMYPRETAGVIFDELERYEATQS